MLGLLKQIIAAKSSRKGPCLPEIIPSLRGNNLLTTVHGDYQYALSEFLRHVNSTGRPLESSIPCTCLSEITQIPDMLKFTSDDHAIVVIRVIRCIVTSSMAGQCEREQDFVSPG